MGKLTPAAASQRLHTVFQETFLLSDIDDVEQIIHNYSEAIYLMDQIPDTSTFEARVRLFFTNKLLNIDANAEALKQGYKAIEIKEKQATEEEFLLFKYKLYGTLSAAYSRLGKDDSALYIMKLGVREALKHDSSYFAAGPINNLGSYLFDRGQLDSAFRYFKLAEEILDTKEDKPQAWLELLGSIRGNQAYIYAANNELERARQLHIQNVAWYTFTNTPFRVNYSLISLFDVEIQLGLLDSAAKRIDPIEKNLKAQKDTTRYRNQLYFAEVLMAYYHKLEDESGALDAAKRLLLFKEKERQQNTFKSSSRVAISKFNSNRFEQLMQAERKAREDAAQKARSRLHIIILIILASAFLVVFLLVLYRQRTALNAEKLKAKENERKLIEMQLDNKKRDLTDMVLHLSAKQSWAKQLSERIALIESLKGTKRSREFKDLKSEIRNQVVADKNLKMLYDDIENLNAEFYDRLLAAFPDLTKTEKKLCSFLRLRMSNAQIAQFQNINPDSVRLSRYRLRNKLKLPKDVNLDDYLQSF